MREDASNWLRQSELDLNAARDNSKMGHYFVCAFLCQQASEKALKAYGLEHLRENVKMHNLLALAKNMKLPKEVFEALIDLTPDFIISRYPDAANAVPADIYDSKKAQQKIVLANRVVEWVKSRIK
ncbi:MAG: HEPN domain-containing protein [Candidatus Micrarchaeota archaeon]